MRTAQAHNKLKPEWFGRDVSILLSNGKKIAGEITEANPGYFIINTPSGETQVMVHAIILVRLSETDQED